MAGRTFGRFCTSPGRSGGKRGSPISLTSQRDKIGGCARNVIFCNLVVLDGHRIYIHIILLK